MGKVITDVLTDVLTAWVEKGWGVLTPSARFELIAVVVVVGLGICCAGASHE